MHAEHTTSTHHQPNWKSTASQSEKASARAGMDTLVNAGIACYLSKVADFDPPHLHLTPVEFHGDLWHQKTRIPGLSCGNE